MNNSLILKDLTSNSTPYPVQGKIGGQVNSMAGFDIVGASLGSFDILTSSPINSFNPPNLGFSESRSSTTSTEGQDSKMRSRAIAALSSGPLVNGVNDKACEIIKCAVTKDKNPLSRIKEASRSFEAPHKISSFSHLNHSDTTELFHNLNLLTLQQTNFLRTVQRKQQIFPLRYRDDYLRHSSILLLSNGWSSATRYSMCSVPNSVNRSGQCKLHKYCPYCSFLEKQRVLAKYVPCYDSGIWHFLTGSFTGDLAMTGPSSYYDLACYWDAYKTALQELVKKKLVRGVFWTEELAVNSIAPVHVLPHIHAIIEADTMDDETLLKLKELVVANLKSELGPDHLAPNIKIKNINSQRKLLSHLQYQIKPIQIVKAYDLAWSHAVHNNRAGAVQLNSETTDLVLGYSTITKDRLKLNSAGNLNSKTKMYIGTRKQELKAAQEVVKAVIKEGADYIEIEDSETEELTTTK